MFKEFYTRSVKIYSIDQSASSWLYNYEDSNQFLHALLRTIGFQRVVDVAVGVVVVGDGGVWRFNLRLVEVGN